MQKPNEVPKEEPVRNEIEYETCPGCNGSGREVTCGFEERCQRCSGDGVIPKLGR